jgi:hypothetical protein
MRKDPYGTCKFSIALEADENGIVPKHDYDGQCLQDVFEIIRLEKDRLRYDPFDCYSFFNYLPDGVYHTVHSSFSTSSQQPWNKFEQYLQKKWYYNPQTHFCIIVDVMKLEGCAINMELDEIEAKIKTFEDELLETTRRIDNLQSLWHVVNAQAGDWRRRWVGDK